MQTHDLIQGSKEWHDYRATHLNASDAPAMLGVSPYKSRTELLHERYTGAAKEIDSATQALFDNGHRFEALARGLAEEIVGQDLYPVTGSNGEYSASFDGLTMDESVAWEHKTLNDEIRAAKTVEDLAEYLRVQMEQQLLVSGAEKCLFLASKWDREGQLVEAKHIWYEPDAELRAKITSGWEQFTKDLAAYQHVEILPAAVAAPTMDLPALSIRVNGAISLQSNLVIFGDRLNAFINGIDKNPSDDQAFADCEAAVKVLQKAQDALEAAEASALAQTADIDDMRKTVAMYSGMARTNRLMLEKLVKTRKETIRIEIQKAAKDKAAEHIAGLNNRLGKSYMPIVPADFAGVMKGKKSIVSLRDAVDTELSRFKIEANAIADKIQFNLNTLRDIAADHKFLFADAAQIVLKANDDCTALIRLRIAEHKEAEEKRLAAERARIQEEERIKAEAKVKREAEEQAAAERQQAMLAAAQQRRDEEATAKRAEPVPVKQEVKVAPAVQAATVTLLNPAASYPFPSKAAATGPTDDEIIEVLSLHFRVHKSKVVAWLLDMDFEAAGNRIAVNL